MPDFLRKEENLLMVVLGIGAILGACIATRVYCTDPTIAGYSLIGQAGATLLIFVITTFLSAIFAFLFLLFIGMPRRRY